MHGGQETAGRGDGQLLEIAARQPRSQLFGETIRQQGKGRAQTSRRGG